MSEGSLTHTDCLISTLYLVSAFTARRPNERENGKKWNENYSIDMAIQCS